MRLGVVHHYDAWWRSPPSARHDLDVRGPIALVGSGEYLPVLTEVERALIAGRPPRFVQLATAAAPEGPLSLAHWHDLGRQAAERLGVEQVVVPVTDRTSAEDPANAALVEGAGLIYLSGGNPPFLARTLRNTAVWRAIHTQWEAGAALAGCSAGAMALTGQVPDLRNPGAPDEDGLGVVPHLRVLPHFDRIAAFVGVEAVQAFVERAAAGVTVLGIDEDTAIVGGPHEWLVQGRQSAWVLTPEGRTEYPSGAALTVS